jgi:hypothetical protein
MIVTIDKAQLEGLIDKRLEDMSFDEREHGPELQNAAKAYYLELVQEHLANTEASVLDDVVHDYEGDVLGFVAGYEACLKAKALF